MREWLIRKLGGYATAEEAIAAKGGYLTIQDAIEAIKKLQTKDRNTILTLAVKKLFNTISADDILKPDESGQWIFGTKVLSEAQVNALVIEAAQLESTLLYKVLKADILYQINKKMYLLAENEMHVITSKFWLYTFDTIKTRITSLAARSALYSRSK